MPKVIYSTFTNIGQMTHRLFAVVTNAIDRAEAIYRARNTMNAMISDPNNYTRDAYWILGVDIESEDDGWDVSKLSVEINRQLKSSGACDFSSKGGYSGGTYPYPDVRWKADPQSPNYSKTKHIEIARLDTENGKKFFSETFNADRSVGPGYLLCDENRLIVEDDTKYMGNPEYYIVPVDVHS
jgi:hypothetical protein